MPQPGVKVFMTENYIVDKVAECLVKAGSTFRKDQKEAYKRVINEETNPGSCWVMRQVLENAVVAEKNLSPLCDDTGIPHILIEIGPNQTLSGSTLNAIHLGIAEGLSRLPGRPMAIRGNDMERIDQSGGLDSNPAALKPAPLIIKPIKEDILRITVLMLGGGPAIRGITKAIFHRHSIKTVIEEIVTRAKEGVAKLGCSPCTLAIGIGRSQFEATALMIEAMVKGNYNEQSDFEKEITNKINEANIGALGLGGKTSVLATFAKIGPQRASGVRIVAIRPCCCFEPRKATVEF